MTLLPRSPLLAGLLAPFFSAALGIGIYSLLTGLSRNPDSDWALRLAAVTLSMLVPPTLALRVAARARRTGRLGVPGALGALVALLTLGMAVVPVRGGLRRARQAANLALSGVPAPDFRARDLDGRIHRLSDYRGSVVLVNIWATWCPPCRAEMPELDRIATEKADRGFVVFGISTEDEETQRTFRDDLTPVRYPLLLPGALEGEEIPPVFLETARYPANFLIDREGLLHPAPSTDQPFAVLEAEVERLLATPSG